MFVFYIGKGSCKCLFYIGKGSLFVFYIGKVSGKCVFYIGKGSCKCLCSILVKGPVNVGVLYW